jgi:H+-transporting ATPase
VDEAATMDVLCADKTGTLTRNALTVTPFIPCRLRRGACSGAGRAGQLGWRAGPGRCRHSRGRRGKPVSDAPKLVKFVPFDPATKMSEATATDSTGGRNAIVKGAFAAVIGLAQPSPTAQRRPRNSRGRAFGCWRSRPDRRRR